MKGEPEKGWTHGGKGKGVDVILVHGELGIALKHRSMG